MQYRQYGKEGPQLSVLGFGVMRLPPRKKDDWGSVNFSKSVPVMRAAMEAGVNFFDSHHNYHNGLSEVAIGKALKGWKGQRIYIQTKTPFYNEEPIDHFKKLLHEALEKTGVNCIDYLLFHSLRLDTFNKRFKEFLKFSDWALREGLIAHRGFSSHDSAENIKTFVDTGEFECMLVSYNWLNPAVADAIAHADDKGMGVSIMNPVGGGSLAADTPQILSMIRGAESGAEVALRYVISTPGVTTAFSGMNSLEQVEENVRIADRKVVMTPKQRQGMLEKLDKIERESKKICTSCGYCMPCPHGVDIPNNFRILNQARLLGLLDISKRRFRHMKNNKDGDRSALACKACGVCLSSCPNDIPIIEQLSQTAELLDTE